MVTDRTLDRLPRPLLSEHRPMNVRVSDWVDRKRYQR
jgi:hypothetical protein